ncbi:MAG: sigma 54-interacting transcriptional regulator, partial [Syntrophomonas sp.]|nr:sigma 54-interacting transcriptional regulator [Syntrophomonas sp.]
GTVEYLRGGLDVIRHSTILGDALLNANNEAVIIVDNKSQVIKVNPAFEGMFGLSNDEAKNKPLDDVLPGITLMNKRLLGIKRTVRALPVIVNQLPIIANEVWIGTVITLLDLSDYEEISRELELVKKLQRTLNGIIKAVSDGVIVVNRAGEIRYINQKASELFDMEADELKGKPASLIFNKQEFEQIMETGLPEVKEHDFNKTKGILYYVPIKQEDDEGGHTITGLIITIYLGDNVATREEIAIRLLSLTKQVQYYRQALEKKDPKGDFGDIVSKNTRFNQVKHDAQRIARTTSTILITGESGVGKDMFARAIHAASPRAKQPFVKVNCAAIPESLLESELFGYAPGSFTGASKTGKPGYFEQADKGTIFLDEIGDMPLSIQVKILQVLQEKQFMRVGGIRSQSVDVRIIAATNQNLREAIANGTFREDLYYRLNVIEFSLPALRERTEDILPLAFRFVEKYNEILGSAITGISAAARQAMESYHWPGNIRELENAIERAANYAWEGEIGTEHLPAHLFHTDAGSNYDTSDYRAALHGMDREIIARALREANGNKSAAARSLNMSRSAFYDKLNKYAIS